MESDVSAVHESDASRERRNDGSLPATDDAAIAEFAGLSLNDMQERPASPGEAVETFRLTASSPSVSAESNADGPPATWDEAEAMAIAAMQAKAEELREQLRTFAESLERSERPGRAGKSKSFAVGNLQFKAMISLLELPMSKSCYDVLLICDFPGPLITQVPLREIVVTSVAEQSVVKSPPAEARPSKEEPSHDACKMELQATTQETDAIADNSQAIREKDHAQEDTSRPVPTEATNSEATPLEPSSADSAPGSTNDINEVTSAAEANDGDKATPTIASATDSKIDAEPEPVGTSRNAEAGSACEREESSPAATTNDSDSGEPSTEESNKVPVDGQQVSQSAAVVGTNEPDASNSSKEEESSLARTDAQVAADPPATATATMQESTEESGTSGGSKPHKNEEKDVRETTTSVVQPTHPSAKNDAPSKQAAPKKEDKAPEPINRGSRQARALVACDGDVISAFKQAFIECIETMPFELNRRKERQPLSQVSMPVLHEHEIVAVDAAKNRRFAYYNYYCRLCENHVRNVHHVLDHIRCIEHTTNARRKADRDGYARLFPQPLLPAQERSLSRFLHFIGYSGHQCMNEQLAAENIIHFVREVVRSQISKDCDVVKFGSFVTLLFKPEQEIYDLNLYISVPENRDVTLGCMFSRLIHVLTMRNTFVPGMVKHLVKESDWVFPAVRFVCKLPKASFIVHCTMDPRARLACLSSKLIYAYTWFPTHFRTLALFVRNWAQQLHLNNRFFGAMSSYAFDLMVVHFLQQKDLLPVLHEVDLGMPLDDFLQLQMPDEFLERLTPLTTQYQSKAEQLHDGRLLCDFFAYYAFEFGFRDVCQITQRSPVERGCNGQRYLVIQDPLLKCNVAKIRGEVYAHLVNCFLMTWFYFRVPRTPVGPLFSIPMTVYEYDSSGVTMRYLCCSKEPRPVTEDDLRKCEAYEPRYSLNSDEMAPYTQPPVMCACCRKAHTESNCRFAKPPPADHMNRLRKGFSEALGRWIESVYNEGKVSQEHLDAVNQELDWLTDTLRQGFGRKDLRLTLFGSITSGFGDQCSDLDICLRFSNDEGLDEGMNANDVILQAARILTEHRIAVDVVLYAKVPIFKFRHNNFRCDVSVGNTLALHNTRMLRTYCELDERVAKLGVAIKKWAKFFNINDASQGTLSSYSYIVMLIYYLQRTHPPVLPNLQEMGDSRTEKLISGWNVYFLEDGSELKQFERQNKQSLAELFVGFFDYLETSVDFDFDVLQIRNGQQLSKMDKGDWCNYAICVEDPFDLDHNLTAGVKGPNFMYFLRCVHASRKGLRFLDTARRSSGPDSVKFVLNDLLDFVPSKSDQGRCFICGGRGHLKSQCPTANKAIEPKPLANAGRSGSASEKKPQPPVTNNTAKKETVARAAAPEKGPTVAPKPGTGQGKDKPENAAAAVKKKGATSSSIISNGTTSEPKQNGMSSAECQTAPSGEMFVSSSLAASFNAMGLGSSKSNSVTSSTNGERSKPKKKKNKSKKSEKAEGGPKIQPAADDGSNKPHEHNAVPATKRQKGHIAPGTDRLVAGVSKILQASGKTVVVRGTVEDLSNIRVRQPGQPQNEHGNAECSGSATSKNDAKPAQDKSESAKTTKKDTAKAGSSQQRTSSAERTSSNSKKQAKSSQATKNKQERNRMKKMAAAAEKAHAQEH